MKDRAMQSLHLLALLPIAETTADINSYGFRPKRSCIDAIEQCFRALSKKASAEWILEGDIKSCFDTICHQWMLNNITTDTSTFRKWLKAGYIEKESFYETFEGVPQGGIISPTATNIVLDGLENLLKSIVKQADKVNYIRYADDFIITGSSRELLEDKIKPAVIAFLNERSLSLSEEKTRITHINEGFDFLGFNLRKYHGKLLIKPSKEGVKAFLRKIRQTIKMNASATTLNLIRLLNPMIQGWGNYYRHVVSKQTFGYIDSEIFKAIWRWIKRRHPMKNARWRKQKYFKSQGLRNWEFHDKFINTQGEKRTLCLFKMSGIEIRRHIKLKGKATPFSPEYIDYFKAREQLKLHRLSGHNGSKEA
jgi:RNA-directed DNA polymerase